jgi:hypothetical protein
MDRLVGQGLVLVCAARGAVVWMQPYSASIATLSLRLSAFGVKRMYSGDGHCGSCTICFSLDSLETTSILTIESNSNCLNVLPVQTVEVERNIWGALINYGLKLIISCQIAVT